MAILRNLTIADAEYLSLPVGTTAQRPNPAAVGMIRGNSTIGWLETYNGTEWIPVVNAVGDGLTPATAGSSARAIKALTGTTTTGFYWIQNLEMKIPTQVYCDMSYDGGGWMLIAYGFVNTAGVDTANRLIPNLNHDGTQYPYSPTNRSSSHGLVTPHGAQQTAVKLSRNANNIMYAAGGNPSTGGIDSYTYVYRSTMPDPKRITYRNHSYYFSGVVDTPAQTINGCEVIGLKGDLGTFQRYTITECLGASWGDSFPTGYGMIENSNPNGGSWDRGPFFPSVHSGSGHASYAPNPALFTPDLGTKGWQAGTASGQGSTSYTYRGWYGANTVTFGQTGQMSIWLK